MEINLTKCGKALDLTENEVAELLDFAMTNHFNVETDDECINLLKYIYTKVDDLAEYSQNNSVHNEEMTVLSTGKLYRIDTTMSEKGSKTNIDELITFYVLKDDDYLKSAYNCVKTNYDFTSILTEALNYCFHDDYFNPYLDKEYIDMRYLTVRNLDGTKRIINLDDIIDVFIDNLSDCSTKNCESTKIF